MHYRSLTWLLCAGLVACGAGQKDVRLGSFSDGDLDGWQQKVFRKQTFYEVVDDEAPVLRAVSHGSASALHQRVEIDLQKTPWLNWRWKIEHTLGDLDASTKAGDDYAARVYVVISPEPFRLKPRSLNYVWANRGVAGSHWQSPYSSEVVMLAVQSGEQRAGQWLQEKRNVLEDLQRLFGEEVRYVEGIAVMTDSDDSDGEATAYYGDIYFSAE